MDVYPNSFITDLSNSAARAKAVKFLNEHPEAFSFNAYGLKFEKADEIVFYCNGDIKKRAFDLKYGTHQVTTQYSRNSEIKTSIHKTCAFVTFYASGPRGGNRKITCRNFYGDNFLEDAEKCIARHKAFEEEMYQMKQGFHKDRIESNRRFKKNMNGYK